MYLSKRRSRASLPRPACPLRGWPKARDPRRLTSDSQAPNVVLPLASRLQPYTHPRSRTAAATRCTATRYAAVRMSVWYCWAVRSTA